MIALLGCMSCGGQVDDEGGKAASQLPPVALDASSIDASSEPDTASPSSTPPPFLDSGTIPVSDASVVEDAPAASGDASGLCTDPIPVALGNTLSGTTCGGTLRPPGEAICEWGTPVVYFYVEAPAGVAVQINSTTNLAVLQFKDCADPPTQCTYSSMTFAPSSASYRLFGVQNASQTCGNFDITAVNQ